MLIKVGSKVSTPKGVGEVINDYDFCDSPIVIVKLEDKTVGKFLREDVKVIQETEEPVEERTITISREDFQKAVFDSMKEISNISVDLFTLTAIDLAGRLVTGRLEKNLFGDSENV